ncbi:MAG: 7,8-didemethyl-8-hydroxy-5-deazariboflavin synthase CofG, partial [Clostridia bacterium]|nr:7,8-didemethyl-8-hydroxy-5-deazariboflavin synthase CofG [Clostridia bacterium]
MLNHQRLKFSGVKLEKLYEFLEPSTPWFRLKDEVKGIMSGRASKVITFSRNISIPLSTICRNKCGYCGFRNSTGPLEKRVLSPDEVHDLLQKGAAAGCKEALFIMGEKPEEACPEIRQLVRSWGFRNMIDYLYHLCLLALDMGLLPHSNVGLLEAEEMARLREVNASMGLMLESVSMNLCQQGAAHQLSPGKHPAVRLAHIREAGRQRIPFTTGILVGIGEKPWERVDSILALKRLQEEYG